MMALPGILHVFDVCEGYYLKVFKLPNLLKVINNFQISVSVVFVWCLYGVCVVFVWCLCVVCVVFV